MQTWHRAWVIASGPQMGARMTLGGHALLFMGSSLTAVVVPFICALKESFQNQQFPETICWTRLACAIQSHWPGLATLIRRPGNTLIHFSPSEQFFCVHACLLPGAREVERWIMYSFCPPRTWRLKGAVWEMYSSSSNTTQRTNGMVKGHESILLRLIEGTMRGWEGREQFCWLHWSWEIKLEKWMTQNANNEMDFLVEVGSESWKVFESGSSELWF